MYCTFLHLLVSSSGHTCTCSIPCMSGLEVYLSLHVCTYIRMYVLRILRCIFIDMMITTMHFPTFQILYNYGSVLVCRRSLRMCERSYVDLWLTYVGMCFLLYPCCISCFVMHSGNFTSVIHTYLCIYIHVHVLMLHVEYSPLVSGSRFQCYVCAYVHKLRCSLM